MGEEEIAAFAEVVRSGWLGLGPRTAEFERRFAEFVEVEHCVGLSSATAALDLAMRLLHVGPNDEVIVPTMTFVSTAHAVAYNLAKPIFCDVDPVTLNLDLEDVRRKITPRTRAIIAVHYGGRPVDMDALREVAGPDIALVEDCAHATGARYKGRSVGGLGEIGCFSFQAVKNLATGDGGALTTSRPDWRDRAKRLRWLGIDKGTWDRTAADKTYWWQYSVDEVGLKCHMNDIQAALGLVQLAKLEAMNDRRREIAARYRAGLREVEQVELPAEDDETYQSAWHIFHIKCQRRDDLSEWLQRNGISTGVHYTPIHTYRCYGNRPTLPVAERVGQRILTLPLFPDLVDEAVDSIVDQIRAFYA
jgi:perosamine synthetase